MLIMDTKLTDQTIIKFYKEAFGKGDQLITLPKIIKFARLIEEYVHENKRSKPG